MYICSGSSAILRRNGCEGLLLTLEEANVATDDGMDGDGRGVVHGHGVGVGKGIQQGSARLKQGCRGGGLYARRGVL
jgi:hypothetical protein